jgi:hypothetical protein
MNLTPENLRSVFLSLQAANLDAVVVGGQAVNLWATKYVARAQELGEFLPFASEDLDFYGGKIEVLSCRDALQGEAKLNRDFDPSPNSGLVLVKSADTTLRIDFLASVYGLNDSEIDDTAIAFSGQNELSGVNIKVLHPVLCLEGKLRSLRGLPQQGRQDLKHAKMSILCVKEFFTDLCQQSETRSGLKLVERLLGNTLREDGLSAWYHHGIKVESAIPFDVLRLLPGDKWQRFLSQRLPQVTEQIDAKRSNYQNLMNKMAEAAQNKNQEALETADATITLLNCFGETTPSGSVIFKGNKLVFAQSTEGIITITNKSSERQILKLADRQITFSPSAEERKLLSELRKLAKDKFQQHQQKKGLSL